MFMVSGGELACHAAFPAPKFSVVDDDALEPALFAALSKYGLRLADMRFERGTNFGDEHIICSIYPLSTFVRVYLDRVEIHCVDSLKCPASRFKSLVADSLDAMLKCEDVVFGSYATTVGLHGTIEGLDTKEFLERFSVTPPQTLRPLIGHGLVFYYGASEQRVMSSVTLDLSATVSGGLFMRTHALWAAATVGTHELPELAEKYFTEILNSIELSVQLT